jgi:hypothetical protein
MDRMFWPALAVLLIGLFMLIAGIGPLWLPIVVVLAGGAAVVRSKTDRRRHSRSSP